MEPVVFGDYVLHDPAFQRLVIGHARLERLWTGGRWTEGPVYVPAAKSVLWSDIPNDRVLRLDEPGGAVSVFEQRCGFHNGHTLDREGRVIACEHGGRRISRLEHDGRWVTLADRWDGKQLNSPNDVVVKRDGTVWFTDPTYGIDSHYEGYEAASDIGHCHVFCLDPIAGTLRAVVHDMVRPNGLAFSPDESTLFVADTGLSHDSGCSPDIRAYPVQAGNTLGVGRVFATCGAGLFDGFRADRHGNLWCSSADSVRCHGPDGRLLGRIPVPEIVSNLCFGGPRRNRLYITAQTSLYAIYLNTVGA